MLDSAMHYGKQYKSKGVIETGKSLIQDYMDDGKINLSNTAPTQGNQPAQGGNNLWANL
jgi:hypothetical protein